MFHVHATIQLGTCIHSYTHMHSHTTHHIPEPQDIIENNMESVLKLLWHLIWFYQISAGGGEQLAKKLLLGWVNSSIPNMATSNFTTDWSSGARLSALVDHCQPGLIPNYSSLDPHNALHNIENAMSLAEKHLNIPRVLLPEDLAVPKPDELSVMTYISYFCQPGSAGRYRVLNWINQRIPKPVSNFTTDWTDGCALGALTNAVSGGGFAEYKSMKAKNALENCRSSMDAATRLLSIQQITTPEEFASSNLDRVLRITYLTQFLYSTSYLSTPGTVTVTGPGITGALCGSETSFDVNARVLTKDQLQVSVVAPAGNLVPLHFQAGMSVHSYSYKPDTPGVYTVQVKLGGEHVAGSPYKVRHSSPFTLTRCTAEGPGLAAGRVDEATQFVVNCETGIQGELQVKVRGPNGSVATGVHSPKERNYVVNFTPYEVGIHTIRVLWGNKDITGSPFECNVTDPTRCVGSGAGLKSAVVGQPQQFLVKTDRAGKGVLTAECKGSGGVVVPVAIAEETLGSYKCTYTLRERGDHSIHVWWSSVPIPGSPFLIHTVLPADASKCKVIGLPSGRLQVGKSYSFMVDAGGTGAAELVVTTSGVVKCRVTETELGQHYVTFTPTDIGRIQLVPTFAGAPIPGSPFEFRVNNPSKCTVDATTLAEGQHYNNCPIDFLVCAQQVGEGELTAVAQTLNTTTDIEVRRQVDGNFLCHYLPQVEGPQAINIYFDKTAIPDTPVWLFVKAGFQADKILVGQPAPGRFGSFMVEHPYDFQIKTSGVTSAKLTASGKGLFTGKELPVSVVEVDREEYKVTMEAAVPDQYVISIKWGEEGVPGSPFLIKVEDKPHADRVVVEGPHYLPGSPDPIKLSINAEKAGAGELKVTCHGEKVGAVPVDVQQLQPKTFCASFGAKEPDVYTIKVLWAYVAVPGSPFVVDTTPPDASKCIVSDPDVPLEIFKPVELVVDAINAGSGKLTAEAVGRSTGTIGSIAIKELPSEGKYAVQLHTTTADIYTLVVRWAGQHIGKSPYTLNLHPPIPSKVIISQPPTQTMDAGQSISISFSTLKAGRGSLVAICTGNKTGEVPTKTTEREGSIWDVKFTPPEPDVYSLSVKWARQPIRGSPFQINLMPLNIDSVKVVGPTQQEGPRGAIELQVITKGAGKGKLGGKVSGPHAGVVPVQVVETEQDVFLITFNPPMTDVYSMEVLFGGQNIKGSPFLINTLLPDASKVVAVQMTPAELSQVVSFHCDTSQAGFGVLTSSCHGDKHGAVQVDVVKVDCNHYTISFTPAVPDRYNLRIEWSGAAVKGSPFVLNLLPLVPYKVCVGELHVPSSIGKGELVYVDLDYSHVGQGATTAVVKGNLVGHIPVDVDTLSTFVRRVKFIPRIADVYHLSIQFGEGHVSGSPFVINLLPPQSEKVELLELMTSFGAVGPITFLFDTSKAGKGNMSIRASGSASGPVVSHTRVVGLGRCKAWFTPAQPETYKVDVMWENSPVPGFPFTFNLLPLCYPERVICGQPVIRAVGKPVVTTIDTSRAGKGNLMAQCHGRVSGQVNVEVQMENAMAYRTTFIPDVEDIYDLKIFYNDKEVSGSPLKVSLVIVKEESELQVIEEQVWTSAIPQELISMDGNSASNSSTPVPSAFLTPDRNQFSTRVPPRPSSVLQWSSSNVPPHAVSSLLPLPVSLLRPRTSSAIPQTSASLPRISPSPLTHLSSVHQISSRTPSSFSLNSRSSPPHTSPPNLTPPLSLDLGDALKIVLVNDGEGYDDFEVSAVGQETGLTDVKLSDNGDGTATIIFAPEKPDHYVLGILLDGEHIPCSPFVINSLSQVNPDRCTIFGLQEACANPTVGQELKFGVDGTKAGEGTLDVRSEGPSEDGYPSELEVYPGEQPGVSHIVYVPTAPGTHRIYFTWSGVSIPCSPVEFTVHDVEEPEVRIYPVGKKVSKELTVECKQADLLATCSHKETGSEQKVKIRKVATGLYKFKIIPKVIGTYVMCILARGKEITESPINIKVGPPPDPAAVQVQQFPKATYVSEPVNITLDASKAGAGFLSVALTTPKGAEDCPVTKKCKAQVYNVTFVPKSVGEYSIGLSWANQPIPGGPYLVSVKDAQCDVRTGLATGTNIVLINHPVEVQLLKLPLGHKVTAQAVGTLTSDDVTVTVDDQTDLCFVRFQPNRPDRYSLEVKVNGSHVNGSPFRVVGVDSGSLLSSDGDFPPALMPLLGKPVNLVMPHANVNAETTQVVAVTKGPSTSPPTFTNTATDGFTVLSFTPSEPGVHHVQPKRGETPLDSTFIPVSPWRSDCHLLRDDLEVFSKVWPLTPGLTVPFRVSTEFGGKGTLDASIGEGPAKITDVKVVIDKPAKGKDVKKATDDVTKAPDLKVEDNNNGIHTCTITPWAVGRYTINVLWNGEHVDGSPFVLNIKLNEVITGLNLQNETFHVGIPHNMTINCDFTENGKFELLCIPPSGADVVVEPTGRKNVYKCEITPQLPGPHELRVLYNGEHILGSPFFVEFEEHCGALYCTLVSSSLDQSEVGQPVEFIVSTKGAGEGILTAEVQNVESGAVFPVTVERLAESHSYRMEFTPGQSNEYLLVVKFDGKHIVGSPFSLVFAEPQDTNSCRVEGEGLTVAIVDKPNTFLVVHTGGDGEDAGELQVLITGDSGIKGPHTFRRSNNTYEILYVPSREGDIQVAVKWDGEHISGSPFKVPCCRSSNPMLFSIESPPTQTHSGKETVFKVRAKQDVHKGIMSIFAKSSSGKTSSNGSTKCLTRHEYECTLPPLNAGTHEVVVRWNEKDVQGSPFSLTVMNHPLVDKIKVEGTGLTNGIVGKECEFTVDTSEGGIGTLTMRLQGPKGALKFNMRKHPSYDRKIVATYTPIDEGDLKISVLWSGAPVPGSPFLATIATT